MWHLSLFLATALGLAALSGAEAASCSKDDFGRAVDQAGAALRKINADNAPKLRAKMRELKERKGWADADFEDKALAAIQDDRIEALNAQANDLLARLDALGSTDPVSDSDCAKIAELGAASLELQATIKAKAAYTLLRLEQLLAPQPVMAQPSEAKTAEAKTVEAKTGEAKTPDPKSRAQEGARPRLEAPKPPPPPGPLAQPPKAGPESSAWSAETRTDPSRDVAVLQPPAHAPMGPLAPGNLAPDEDGYTIDEIMAASAGFFGKVSANLGAVIEYLFQRSGRPTGYVLGTEGGGAFLAGVRYGSGTLYLRAGGSQKIYWHGPSLGTDVGAEGSKTLFLIYHLRAPEEIYARFTGIDGSAYLVGGVGATFVTNGSVIMAPIRSGMGLRLGANIGYIRFTPKATWNPF
jgi:hypothetical protein